MNRLRQSRTVLAVAADRKRRANVECALCRCSFFRCLGLLEKINVRLVVVVFHQIGCFIQTNPAQTAGRIDVPGTGNVLGLLSIFVRHGILLLDAPPPSKVFF